MKKQLFIGALMAAVLGVGLGYQEVVEAHPGHDKKPAAGAEMKKVPERRGPGGPGMRGPRRMPTKEEIVERVSKTYGYDKAELMALVDNGVRAFDLNTICNYAKLADKPLTEIAELRKTMTRGRIEYALGLTPEVMAAKQKEKQIDSLAKDGVVNKATADKLLSKGYGADEIKYAAALATLSNKKLEAVLKTKTAANTWADVAKKAGVSEADAKAVAEKNRVMPARKSGPGFSGIHYRGVDAELVSSVLHDNFLFSKKEIAKYYNAGVSFGDLDVLCLYAYCAKQPLAKVMAMRNKLTVGQIKVQLGLTPQKFHDAVVAYQARRLKERMNMPEELTSEYLNKGYSLHHLNVAFLMAPMCGKDIDTLIAMKNPGNRWEDVAKQVGMSAEDYKKKIAGRIYYEFQNKYEKPVEKK